MAEGVSALGEEVNLCWHAGVIEGTGIKGSVADLFHGVVPGLQQEGRRRLPGHLDAGIEGGTGATDVPRIERDGKVGAAAFGWNQRLPGGRLERIAGPTLRHAGLAKPI